MNAEALKGHLDGLVLAVVAQEPAHGYLVISRLRERSGGELDLPEGTIYPVLHRLEKAGLLRSGWSADSGRRRRVYALTASGDRALGERRAGWHAFAHVMDRVMGAPA